MRISTNVNMCNFRAFPMRKVNLNINTFYKNAMQSTRMYTKYGYPTTILQPNALRQLRIIAQKKEQFLNCWYSFFNFQFKYCFAVKNPNSMTRL